MVNLTGKPRIREVQKTVELRHLRYFVCVAEERNIGRAAERLHMSQPPLTRQIRQLESELDTKLLVRTHRGVELTNAGRVFLKEARKVLDTAEQAAQHARLAGQGKIGRIDIAIFGTGIFGAIPKLLKSFRDEHPDVQIVLHNMTKDEQLQALSQGRIELAFNRLVLPTPGLTSEVLLVEPLFIAMPADSPLAATTAIDVTELESKPLVLYPTGMRPSFIDQAQALCRNAGFEPHVAAEFSDAVHALAFVAIGGGFAIVPESATNLRLPGVVYRPIHDRPQPTVDLCVIYRDDAQAPVLGNLLASIRTAACGLTSQIRPPVQTRA